MLSQVNVYAYVGSAHANRYIGMIQIFYVKYMYLAISMKHNTLLKQQMG